MLQVEQFPLLVKYDLRHLTKAIGWINEAREKGGLRKTDLKSITENLNWALEKAYEEHVLNVHVHTKQGLERYSADDTLYDSLSLRPECHTIAGNLKKIEKAKLTTPFAQAAEALYREILPFQAIVKDLKTKIVVRLPPVDPVLAYQAPEASRIASRAIYDLLIKITQANADALVETIIKQKNIQVETFTKAQAEAQGKPEKELVSIHSFTTVRVDQYRSNVKVEIRETLCAVFGLESIDETTILAPLPSADDKIKKMAVEEAAYLQKMYVKKNMEKTDSIVEAKGDFGRAEIISQSRYLIEGSFRVFFKDGSAFTAKTSIVHSYSVLGTPFTRYPLTFHDVTLGGKTTKMFSEEEMNTKFVGK